MKAFQIKERKKFMSRLLATDSFDSFLLAEATITTYNSFVIDGHVNKEFFLEEEGTDASAYTFSQWENMRALCFDLIKGKHTPLNFKFVLHLKPEVVVDILSTQEGLVSAADIRAFVLNIKYDGSELICITGTSLHTFLPDKTPDLLWDAYITNFLEKRAIAYEPLS